MDRRLRVAIVAASLRILGGHSVQAERLLHGWADDPRVEAWLVPIDPVPRSPFDRLLRVKYLRTIVTQLCYWPRLLAQVARADVVHVFSASYTSFLLAPLPAVLVARLLGRPIVLNYHSGEAPDHLRRSRLARLVLRRWVHVNAVPSAFLREVLERFAIAAHVVPNTIDLKRFSYRVRDPLGPHLLSTRNLEPIYNVACTLRAFARIQARHPRATLTLVGAGSQETSLRALARELGLRGVTFAGRIQPSDMPRYYDAADIYVQTPDVDNMPLSLLEAFASGLPAVSTAVGGVPAILAHGEQGLFAPAGKDDAVAAQIETLLDAPSYARQLAAAAHDSCSRYAWSAARERWLEVYEAALAAAGKPLRASAAEQTA